MSDAPNHLIERAVERMAELAGTPAAAPPSFAPSPPPSFAAAPVPLAPAPAEPTTPSSAPSPSPSPSPSSAPAPSPAPSGAEVDMAMLEAAGLAVAGVRRSRVAEEWRVTAGQLLRTLRAVRPAAGSATLGNLMLVTSTKPNEGKSFCALNLAGSLTLGGMAEVLLLDVDSKPGAMTEMLGLGGQPGLFDLVADPTLRVEQLLVKTAIPGLSILPIGRLSASGPAASERSVTRPVVAAIERVARRFANRVLVLDCAPCLATSDPSALAPVAGAIAMVVEAERTQRHDVETALELLRTCSTITVVLNKARTATTHAFGHYNYYNA